MLAHYGSFYNVGNYFAATAKDGRDVEIGYYGERLVLLSQQLGLNTCWVALTYSKGKVPVECAPGEKLRIVIALGYGETQGVPHKSKKLMSLWRPLTFLCKFSHWCQNSTLLHKILSGLPCAG